MTCLTLSVCGLLGHSGQLHLPFSQGQPVATLDLQTLFSKMLGERTIINVEDEYPYLQLLSHVQLLVDCIIYVFDGCGFGCGCGRTCFGGRWCFYIRLGNDAESHIYETYSINIRAYVPHMQTPISAFLPFVFWHILTFGNHI